MTRQPSFSAPTRFADGYAHVGEEHLGELRRAEHRPQRPHLDAGRVHGQDQPRDPAMLRRVGVGAHEELAEVGDLTERAPDLLAVEHVVVAVAGGAGAQRREVGAGSRLGEALAPHLVAPEDAGQVGGLLLRCALGDQRRARVQRADEVDPDVRRPCPRRLLEEDELLGRRRAPAAVLTRPRQARVAGVEEPALPVGVPDPALGPRVPRRLRRDRGQRRDQPLTELGAELLLRLGVPELHHRRAYRCLWSRSLRRTRASVKPPKCPLAAPDAPDGQSDS